MNGVFFAAAAFHFLVIPRQVLNSLIQADLHVKSFPEKYTGQFL